VSILSSVTYIDDSTFESCISLKSINIDSDSEKYCSIDGALMRKTETGLILLKYPRGKKGRYSIPSSVAVISKSAFEDCTGLTSITIPSSVTEISDDAFSGCTGLTSVKIPSSVTEISDDAFEDCTSLTSITIPSSVTKIGKYAFYGCTGLTSVIIEGKTLLYDDVFDKCTLKPLLLKETIKYTSDTFSGLNENSVIYAPESQVEDIKKYFPNTYAHD